MILAGTLLASYPQRVLIEDAAVGLSVNSWQQTLREPKELPLEHSTTLGTVDRLVHVETFFDGGCRECTHQKNKGFAFRVPESAELLTTSGAYLPVLDLVSGHRLRALGCSCGFETVKAITEVKVEPTQIYSVRLWASDNYGITGVGDHVVLIRGDYA